MPPFPLPIHMYMKVIIVLMQTIVCTLVISVCFDQLTYTIPEQGGPLTITMTLSNPSSSEIALQVAGNDGSALGMFLYMYIRSTYVQ